MKKNDLQICVFQDVEHEAKMQKIIDEVLSNVNNALTLYEKFTKQKLQPAEFESFLRNPEKFTLNVLQSKVVVPEGFNKEEYLKLIQYPDVFSLNLLLNVTFPADPYHTNYCKAGLLTLTDQGLQLTETAHHMAKQNNIYLDEKENEAYNLMNEFVETANKLRKINADIDKAINTNYITYFDLPLHPDYEYKFNVQKFMFFLKR